MAIIHGVGLCVARSDKSGNAKALHRGTSNRLAPRFLYPYVKNNTLRQAFLGANRPNKMFSIMKHKHFFRGLLLFLMMFVSSSTFADYFEVDGIRYETTSSTTVSVMGSNPGDVVIPSTVSYNSQTYNVTSIGLMAFFYSDLTSITIPNSVTSIGDHAFGYCSGLTSITIPNSVTSIGRGAFQNCSGLTSITIPNGVTSIGNYAFSDCSGLTSITIPNSVTSIGNDAFYYCI